MRSIRHGCSRHLISMLRRFFRHLRPWINSPCMMKCRDLGSWYLEIWRNSIKQYQRMCHLTCSGPWCQPWLSSWCLPRLLPPWHVVLLGSVVSCHVFLGFLWLLDVSYVWMSSLIFLCQPTVGCHDVLITYLVRSQRLRQHAFCRNPKDHGYDTWVSCVTKSHWIHHEICVHPQPILSTSRIIKNQILHVLHII